jgi:hypothetical protein
MKLTASPAARECCVEALPSGVWARKVGNGFPGTICQMAHPAKFD